MIDVPDMPIPINLADDIIPVAVVDDDEVDRLLVKRFYKRYGLVNPLVQFSDGKAFLDYLESAQKKDKPLPAVVMMDINMPRMNGFDTIRAMQSNHRFGNLPLVIMLTSSNDPGDREQAASVGADGYMLKPYNPSRYLDLFKQFSQH